MTSLNFLQGSCWENEAEGGVKGRRRRRDAGVGEEAWLCRWDLAHLPGTF